jgi:hypothetical protein
VNTSYSLTLELVDHDAFPCNRFYGMPFTGPEPAGGLRSVAVLRDVLRRANLIRRSTTGH